MRLSPLILILLFLSIKSFAQTTVNGSFYISEGKPSYQVTTPTRKSEVNSLLTGVTYKVADGIYDLSTGNESSTLLFSNDILIKLGTNSSFSINSFSQDILNMDNPPQKLQFDNYSLNVGLQKGEALISRTETNSNSLCVFSTKYADFELLSGKIIAKVTDKTVIIYVIDGLVRVHEDKPTIEVVGAGNMIIAVPFLDPSSGLEDKVVTSVKRIKDGDIPKLADVKSDILFTVVDGRIVGVKLH